MVAQSDALLQGLPIRVQCNHEGRVRPAQREAKELPTTLGEVHIPRQVAAEHGVRLAGGNIVQQGLCGRGGGSGGGVVFGVGGRMNRSGQPIV